MAPKMRNFGSFVVPMKKLPIRNGSSPIGEIQLQRAPQLVFPSLANGKPAEEERK